MKKSNTITLLAFCVIIIIITVYIISTSLSRDNTPGSRNDAPQGETLQEETDALDESNKNGQPTDETLSAESLTLKDSLFIGDSRTVGLSEYSTLTGADFFSDVGMSSSNIYDKTVSVPSVGKLNFKQLIQNKSYKRIYLMLGINEVGNDIDTTMKRYEEIISFIKTNQPNADIFIMANLHVSASRSSKDAAINNNIIDNFNIRLEKLAKNKNIYYMNSNSLFDDESGSLDEKKTGDGVHLYAKYYADWAKWIITQTKNNY